MNTSLVVVYLTTRTDRLTEEQSVRETDRQTWRS